MLSACHDRVDKQCRLLLRLTEHVSIHGADASARQAAESVIKYFDTAAVHHHADEEQDLFPALSQAENGLQAFALRQLIRRLCKDHKDLERRWATLRETLTAIARGELNSMEGEAIVSFVQAYKQHIRTEEEELLPRARRVLRVADLESIGRAMAARRGLTYTNSTNP